LRVGRIDFGANTLTVAEQRTRGLGGRMVEGPPKSAAGRRTMSVPGPLMGMLAEHLGRRGLTSVDAEEHVFVGSEGQPLEYSGFRQRTWAPACKSVGLEGLGFHDLRRANATYLVASGVDIKTAQSRLGHSDPHRTLNIYAQVTSAGDRAAAELLGHKLMGPPKQPAGNTSNP
jgi:integrase